MKMRDPFEVRRAAWKSSKRDHGVRTAEAAAHIIGVRRLSSPRESDATRLAVPRPAVARPTAGAEVAAADGPAGAGRGSHVAFVSAERRRLARPLQRTHSPVMPVEDRPWGMREFSVRVSSGNNLRIGDNI